MPLYAAVVALGAFLLFQVQFILAKFILPWFGGSASVWATCMVFFQVVLLLGYLYAHFLTRTLPPARQAAVHGVLLLASMAFLPVLPSASWKPSGAENPAARILLLLAGTVGMPFLMLSATSPLVSAWCARKYRGEVPYRLYALSNGGSMLALLTYPAVFEPFLGSRRQADVWSLGYAAFGLLCAAAALRSRKNPPHETVSPGSPVSAPPRAGDMVLWASLAACGSALMLSVTGHLTQNVAAIPFLWVLPLAVYLLTFILCFSESGKKYRRGVHLVLLLPAFAGCAFFLDQGPNFSNLRIVVPAFACALFVFCMFCHGELAAGKPPAAYLTSFYLMVSFGGAIGGAFVGLAAPALFPGLFDLHASLFACALLVAAVVSRDASAATGPAGRRFAVPATAAILAVALTALLGANVLESVRNSRVAVRNFYASLKVTDVSAGQSEGTVRKLTHGVINHGVEYLDPSRRDQPTTYYGPGSGVGLALLATRKEAPHRVGIVGLGTGTLAAYGRPGDFYAFYEIDPNVLLLARSQFHFLADSKAEVSVVLGDARLSLADQAPQRFDLLVVDAFSSDAIPVHLLTREAFDLYFRHLKADGALAVHVSNKYLDLKPVVRLAADALGKEARLVDTKDSEEDRFVFGSTWVLVTGRRGFFGRRPLSAASRIDALPGQRLWTDGYSNLFRFLK